LLFGAASELPQVSPPPAEQLIGLAWLHAVHARACIARGKLWQAEYMVSGLRDHVLSLACLRHGLPAAGPKPRDRPSTRGGDGAASGRARSALGCGGVARALRVGVEALLTEARRVNETLATRLREVLTDLVATC